MASQSRALIVEGVWYATSLTHPFIFQKSDERVEIHAAPLFESSVTPAVPAKRWNVEGGPTLPLRAKLEDNCAGRSSSSSVSSSL